MNEHDPAALGLRCPHDPRMDMRAIMVRLETMIVRMDTILPHLAAKQDVADFSMAAGAVYLPLMYRSLHLISPT